MRKPYETDLTAAQWEVLQPLIPPARHGGQPRTVDLREVINTLLYQERTGCRWDLLPHDLLPKSTVYDYFQAWRDDVTWQRILDSVRERLRGTEGREPTPSAASIDSQSVKTTEVGGERGYDAGKKVSGRKRHLALDTVGLPLAAADDGAAAPPVLGQLDGERFPRLEKLWADQKYHKYELYKWLEGPSQV